MSSKPYRPPSSTSPWTWALIIYVVLALGAFCFPSGMVDWLDERNASGWLSGPLALAHGLDAVSSALGVKQVGESLRRRFADVVGDTDFSAPRAGCLPILKRYL